MNQLKSESIPIITKDAIIKSNTNNTGNSVTFRGQRKRGK